MSEIAATENAEGAPKDQPFFGHARLTVVEPRRRFQWLDFRELSAYRELPWVLIGRDVRVRYKQTILGAGWAIFRPLLAVGIFSVVFGKVAKMPSEGAPHPVFAMAGVLPWTFFSAAVSGAADSLVGSQHLVSKVYFPRLIILPPPSASPSSTSRSARGPRRACCLLMEPPQARA